MDCHYEVAYELLKSYPNLFFTYDTGNITTAGYDHEKYISRLFPFIINVHLKDRKGEQTVLPGEGETPFGVIFKNLKRRKYKGLYTIQTARGVTGREFTTIKQHIDFFKETYHEAII